MSYEIGNKEIALRQNGAYPDVPGNKKVGTGAEKISDVLVYQGKVSEEQVRLALEAQKDQPRKDLGKVMLSLGFISGADLAQAHAQRLGLDFVELTERDVDRDVVSLVPERLLRKHGAIPLRISRYQAPRRGDERPEQPLRPRRPEDHLRLPDNPRRRHRGRDPQHAGQDLRHGRADHQDPRRGGGRRRRGRSRTWTSGPKPAPTRSRSSAS